MPTFNHKFDVSKEYSIGLNDPSPCRFLQIHPVFKATLSDGLPRTGVRSHDDGPSICSHIPSHEMNAGVQLTPIISNGRRSVSCHELYQFLISIQNGAFISSNVNLLSNAWTAIASMYVNDIHMSLRIPDDFRLEATAILGHP